MYTLIKLAFKVSDMANKASSEYLISLCKCAMFYYDGDVVLVMAFVESETDISILKEYPMIEINWNKYVDIVTTAELGLKYMNGEIEYPKLAVD
jgi:hypothetical protein